MSTTPFLLSGIPAFGAESGGNVDCAFSFRFWGKKEREKIKTKQGAMRATTLKALTPMAKVPSAQPTYAIQRALYEGIGSE